jgi:hypothetical protein
MGFMNVRKNIVRLNNIPYPTMMVYGQIKIKALRRKDNLFFWER